MLAFTYRLGPLFVLLACTLSGCGGGADADVDTDASSAQAEAATDESKKFALAVNPAALATAPTQLPIEVFGAAGAQVSVPLNLSAADAINGRRLWLQTHNVRYPEKASVRINNGAWLALNNTTADLLGTGKTFGGIGGSHATLQMSVPIASGLLRAGTNTVAFRFNASNGLSNGFRIIGLNLLDAAGGKLLPASAFVEADPAQFAAPSTRAADITAGQNLWKNATLKQNYLRGAPTLIARCSDCHTASGADLKYFGYSNKVIVERAKFHGLTTAQGNQIASYIRSLPVKAIGRPWNPPYQPGPGLTAKPNEAWAAGAGIQNVLDNDWDTIKALFPSGVQRDAVIEGGSNSVKFKRLSTHDIPIALQLPDWNHWLPEVHPYDAFGKSWIESTPAFRLYTGIRQKLQGLTPQQVREWYRTSRSVPDIYQRTGYHAFSSFSYWTYMQANEAADRLKATLPPASLDRWGGITDPEAAKKIYSLALWKMVKLFEVNEEFQLTGMGPEAINLQWVPFDSTQALPRMWVGANRAVFDVSPFLLKLPENITGSSSGNNRLNFSYLSNSWYQLQLILNAGQRSGHEHQVIDWGYTQAFLNSFDRTTGFSNAGRNVVWALKGMDEGDNDNGPNFPQGWSFNRSTPDRFLGLNNDFTLSKFWIENPNPQAKEVHNLLRQVWLEKNASWLPVQYAVNLATGQPKSGWEDGINFNRPDYVIGTAVNVEAATRSLAENTDVLMRAYMANKTFPAALQNGYAAWAQAIWPGVDANGQARNNWLKYTVARVGAAPSAPVAAPGPSATSVTISWADTGAASYNVKRSDGPNGPFMTIAYFRSGSSHTERVPLPGRTYYYRISANSDGGESPDSPNAAIAVISQ